MEFEIKEQFLKTSKSNLNKQQSYQNESILVNV
jgi:hypothetical protein